jgi:hypothetical protein
MKNFAFLLFLSFVIILCLGETVYGLTMIGVLEEPQCNDQSGTAVRALFAKSKTGWTSLSSESAARGIDLDKINWVIALHSRKMGKIRTIDPGFTTPYQWTYPRDRLLNISPNQIIPHVGDKLHLFAGWCRAPKNRPLVVVSNGGVSDPDNWKPFEPEASLIARVFVQFRKHAGPAVICPGHSDSSVPFSYTSNDLETLAGYKDRSGRKLISVRLKPRTDGCDGPTDAAWDAHTFLVTAQSTYLGAGLSLVDAGDYDANGKSELLFWFSGYNQDGYVLFSSDLAKETEYLWQYH